MSRFKQLLGWLSAGGLALVIGGCCAAEKCACVGQEAVDDIAIRFNRDTLSTPAPGFTSIETARLLFIREPLDKTGGATTDTLYFDGYPVPAAGENDFLLRRDRPFRRSALGLGAYRYSLVLLRKPGRPPLARYELRDVLIDSRYTTVSACCTCYENVRKEARLDNGELRDLHTPAGAEPAVIELRKF